MKILLCSLGSHGDVHPYLALGQELSLRGHAITFATSSHYRELIERHGIAFAPIRPEAPLDDRAVMARIMDARRGPETVIKEHVMPALRDTYQDLVKPAAQADLLVSHVLTYAVPILAEKPGKPWASTVLSPMVFTLGSSAVRVAGEFYSVAMRAARRLNRRAVLVAGSAAVALKASLPPTMTAVEWASYPGLFSRAAAVVHQGGVGTTAQALRAGVPQLLMPFAHDQFDNADRVRRLGCGRILRRNRLSELSPPRELEALLANDGIAETAREEGRLVRDERGAAHAAEVLLRRFT